MGNGASAGKGGGGRGGGVDTSLLEDPAALNDAEISRLAQKHHIPYRLAEMTKKRFDQLDRRDMGTVRLNDIEHGDPPDVKVMKQVFMYGFGTADTGTAEGSKAATAHTFPELLKPLHLFSPDTPLPERIKWVFKILAQGEKKLTLDHLEEFCSLADVEVAGDLADMFKADGSGTVSAADFTDLLAGKLRQLPTEDVSDIFALPYNDTVLMEGQLSRRKLGTSSRNIR